MGCSFKDVCQARDKSLPGVGWISRLVMEAYENKAQLKHCVLGKFDVSLPAKAQSAQRQGNPVQLPASLSMLFRMLDIITTATHCILRIQVYLMIVLRCKCLAACGDFFFFLYEYKPRQRSTLRFHKPSDTLQVSNARMDTASRERS